MKKQIGLFATVLFAVSTLMWGCKLQIHAHTYSEEWTNNATHHWHKATCEHTEKINKFAEHAYKNGLCVCGMREMVLIPSGTFQMGSNEGDDDNKPVHEVTITKSFYIGKYEITQAEYEKYCSYGENKPNSRDGIGENHPAYYVSWYDALVYCNKRSIAEGLTPCYSILNSTVPDEWGPVPTSSDSTWDAVECDWNANGYRLPTEAEWEYAARAGDDTVDSLIWSGTSDEYDDYVWHGDNSLNKTNEVGRKKANNFDLYDMCGNVQELCWNWYTSTYDTTVEGGIDPIGANLGTNRVIRGGSWGNFIARCAVSTRSSITPYNCRNSLGFRVVRSAS